jgi:hypothetical protein
MSDKALYSTTDTEVIPAGSADGVLKRNAANTGWEFKSPTQLGLPVQTTFVEQSTDTSTTSGTFVDLLTQAITTTTGTSLIISVTGSVSCIVANVQIDFQITIDGTPVRGAGTRVTAINSSGSIAINYRKTGLAAGLHSIKVRWRTASSTARIQPATTLNEHASLLIQEVSV